MGQPLQPERFHMKLPVMDKKCKMCGCFTSGVYEPGDNICGKCLIGIRDIKALVHKHGTEVIGKLYHKARSDIRDFNRRRY